MKEKWNIPEHKGEVVYPTALRLQIRVTKAWEMSSQHLHVSHSTRVHCRRNSHDWELKFHSIGVYFGKKLVPAAHCPRDLFQLLSAAWVYSSKCFQTKNPIARDFLQLDGDRIGVWTPSWLQILPLQHGRDNISAPTNRLSYLFVEQRKDTV